MTDHVSICVLHTPFGCLGTVLINDRLVWQAARFRDGPDGATRAESEATQHADRLRASTAKRRRRTPYNHSYQARS